MIDPRTVMVGIPCHDGKNVTELTGMLVSYRDLFGALTMPTECSHPSLVRNIMADTFLRSGLDWFVGIDSDIVPSRRDFEILLEATDTGAEYWDAANPLDEGHPSVRTDAARPPMPTRIRAQTILLETDVQGSPRQQVSEDLADVLVCAEYAYKRDEFEPVQFGGGFYRAHKSVFNILANLKHPDNGRVEVDAKQLCNLLAQVEDLYGEDVDSGLADSLQAQVTAIRDSMTSQAGTPRVWQASHNGRLFYDFFPSGAMLSAGLPHGDWKGEDHGFWTLCSLAGLIPRIERRTRLIHIGRKGYPYLGADEGSGQ